MNEQASKNVTVTAEFLGKKGYSLTRAAQEVGVSVTHLRLVCKGERKPSKELVCALRRLPKQTPIKKYRPYATI